jgi:hypothetical protein
LELEVVVEVQRGDKDGETKDERSEVELVEGGLTTDQAKPKWWKQTRN